MTNEEREANQRLRAVKMAMEKLAVRTREGRFVEYIPDIAPKCDVCHGPEVREGESIFAWWACPRYNDEQHQAAYSKGVE